MTGCPHPITIPVDVQDPVEHEACHSLHAMLRNQNGGSDRVGVVYLGNGQAAIIENPPGITLRAVAHSIPMEQRGMVYELYLVQAQRDWNNRPLYILDELGCYVNGTAWYYANGKMNDGDFSVRRLARGEELFGYATALIRLASEIPEYDIRQLSGTVAFLKRRIETLRTKN